MRLFRKNLLFIVVLISLILVTLSFFSFPEHKKIILCYQIEKTIQIILERIVNFSNTISKGDFEKSTFDRSLDYLNPEFSSTFVNLGNKLHNIFSELRKEKNELEAILDAMSEGVIVISKKGTITLVNKSAERRIPGQTLLGSA